MPLHTCKMKCAWTIAGLLVCLLVAGCYESTDVTLHEPGVYKGKVDKHEQTPAEREEILRQRILDVQTDR